MIPTEYRTGRWGGFLQGGERGKKRKRKRRRRGEESKGKGRRRRKREAEVVKTQQTREGVLLGEV